MIDPINIIQYSKHDATIYFDVNNNVVRYNIMKLSVIQYSAI